MIAAVLLLLSTMAAVAQESTFHDQAAASLAMPAQIPMA
jgi:hypothetical protein